MAISNSRILTQAMTFTLFVSSVALGVGSAQPAVPSAANFAISPQTNSATTQAIAAPAATTSPGPVVVSSASPGSGPGSGAVSGPGPGPVAGPVAGPGPVAANQNGFQDAANSSQAAAAAARGYAPKPGATPFVPSVVESAQAPKAEQRMKAILHTTMGDITIRMLKNDAPHTVQNFVDLARGDRDFLDPKTSKKVHRPFYTGLIFHRVIKDFIVQTGCPFGTGRGDPGYSIVDEISPNVKFDKPGVVAMALAQDKKAGYEKNSNGSQFFITLAPQPTFNGKFTIFGEVVSGMDVAQRIGHVRTGPTDRPVKKVYLLSIDVDEPGPALLQSSATPVGVNMALPLPIPPPTNQLPPVNQALQQQPNMQQPNIPQMPTVSVPMPASANMMPVGAVQPTVQMPMPPMILPTAGVTGSATVPQMPPAQMPAPSTTAPSVQPAPAAANRPK